MDNNLRCIPSCNFSYLLKPGFCDPLWFFFHRSSRIQSNAFLSWQDSLTSRFTITAFKSPIRFVYCLFCSCISNLLASLLSFISVEPHHRKSRLYCIPFYSFSSLYLFKTLILGMFYGLLYMLKKVLPHLKKSFIFKCE